MVSKSALAGVFFVHEAQATGMIVNRMESALIISGVVLASVLMTELLRLYAHKKEIYDVPNSRSSHSEVTPRGGGAAIVLAFLVSLSLFFYFDGILLRDYLALLGAGGLVSAVGFWDDHTHVHARIRIVFHAMAGIWAVSWIGVDTTLDFGVWEVDLAWFGLVIGLLFLVWLINLYNFMDGIDGIASVETIFVSTSAALFLFMNGDTDTAFALCLLAGACLGFLVWNWPPAKIFMGDVASGFLGITLGVFALYTSNEDSISIWVWLILLGVFVVDSTYTLLKRIYHSERWYEAHRCHAYQFAAVKSGSHKFVTLFVLAINVLWLFPLALLSVWYPQLGFPLLIIAYAPLLGLAIMVGAGKRPELNTFIH